MIYAGDEVVPMPVKDLYDTQIMAMSINAAKDMYEKGYKQMEDFYTKYGDFISPIQKDMDWYNKNVTGKAQSLINYLYQNGVDPLRSAEGRAAISQLIYSMPTGDIAKLKQSAETAKEYIKNRGALQASGKWDPNFERFANQGRTIEDWDTINDGSWTRTSPAEVKTLKELTEPWYNQRTAHMLDKAGVESFGMKYDPKYQYTGFTDMDLLNIAAGQTPGWNGSIYADYYRDVAKQKIAAKKMLSGDRSPITQEDVERQLQEDVAVANREYKIAPVKEADQFALDDYRTRNDIRAHSAKAAIDFAYDKKRASDPVFTANGKGNKIKPNIFREAESLVPSMSPAHTTWGTKAGEHVGYIPSGQYGELIDPVIPAAYTLGKDKNSGQIVEQYVFNKPTIKERLYDIDKQGNVKKTRLENGNESSSFTFVPDGQMKAAKTMSGYRYYISGRIKGNQSDGFAVNKEDGSTQVWIEVKERAFAYDGK